MLHVTASALKMCGALGSCTAVVICAVYVAKAAAQNRNESQPQAGTSASSSNLSPIYGVAIPAGYRDWEVISVNQLVTTKVDQLRTQLGNDIAIKAFKEGTLPFPDGAIIAALHWSRVPSEDNDRALNGAFSGAQSFVIGSPVNVQFMVKDSKKYAATGGWGFADFKDGKPGDKTLHEACFPCHGPAKNHDYVFADYARAP